MAIIVGTNSWVTIAEADAYLTARLGSQDWFTLSDSPASPGEESKETFLVMAYNLLVNKPGYCLTPGMTDENVKNAQSEFAFYLSQDYASFIENADGAARGISSFKLSKWSESYFRNWEGDYALPVFVNAFLDAYRLDNNLADISVD